MAMIGKVKRMHFREKRSVREIVRLTSLSRNTVRKWLKTPVLEEPRYRRGEAAGKARLEDFKRYGSARKLYTFNVDNASSY